MRDFPEPDWKTLSRLKPLALDRLCQRIMLKAKDLIVRAQEGGYHSAYLKLYKHIQNEDRRVADCFNDWRRSQAFFILAMWRREKLLTDEEFAAFSKDTRMVVEMLTKE